MSIVTDVSVQDSIAYLQEFVNQKPSSSSSSPPPISKALPTEAPALCHSASAGSSIVERPSTSSVLPLRSRGGLGKGGRGEGDSAHTGACEFFFGPSRLGSHRHHTTINSVDSSRHETQPNDTSTHPRATTKSTLTSSAHLSSARGALPMKGEAGYRSILPSSLFDSNASRSTVSAPPVTRSSGPMFRYGKDRAAQPSPSSSHRYQYTHAGGAASGRLAGPPPSLSDWRQRRASSLGPGHVHRRVTAPSSFLWRNWSAPASPALRRGSSVSSFLWGWGDGIGDGAHSIDATTSAGASTAASTSPLQSHMRKHMHAGIGDHMRDSRVSRGSGLHTAPYAVRTPRRDVFYEEVTEERVEQSLCPPQRRPPLVPSSTGAPTAAPLDEPVELLESRNADEHAVNVCRIARYLKDYYAREANEKELGIDSLGPEDVAGLAQCFYIDLYRTVRQVRRAAGMDTGAFLLEDPTEDVLVAFRPAPPPPQRELRDSGVDHLGSATSRPPDTPPLLADPSVAPVSTREGCEGVGHHGHHGTVARLPPAAAPTPPHPLPQSYPSRQLTDNAVCPGRFPGSGWVQDKTGSSVPRDTQDSFLKMSVVTDKGQSDAASKASLAFSGDDAYPVQIVRAQLPPFRNDDAAAQDHRLLARGHGTLSTASLESRAGFPMTSTSLAYRETVAPGTAARLSVGGAATLPSFPGDGGDQSAFLKPQNTTQSLPQQQLRSVNDASGAVLSLPAGRSHQSMPGQQKMTTGTTQPHPSSGSKGLFPASTGSLPLLPLDRHGVSVTRKNGGRDLSGQKAALMQSLGRRQHLRSDSSSDSTCGAGDGDAAVRGSRKDGGRSILAPPQGRLCRIIKRPLKELMPLLRCRSTFILKYSDHLPRPHLRRFQILDCTDTYGGREVLMPHLTWATPEGVGQHEQDRVQRVRHSKHGVPLLTGLSLSKEEVSYTTALNLIYLDAVHVGIGSGIIGPYINLFRGSKGGDKRSGANENSRRSNGASAAVSGSGGFVVVDHKGRPVSPEMCAIFVFASRPVAVSFLSEDDRQLWVGAMMGVVERNRTLKV